MKELIKNVLQWAEDKEILSKATAIGQYKKTCEEVGELGIALNADDLEEIKDGIGDTTVTLIILAEMHGLTLEECLAHAYGVISKRTGKMINGQFVKNK
jgi:NTP pyrophosphatase (non-canonical NTP hydrolase)